MDTILWQQREQTLLDALQEAAILVNEQGTILYANPIASDILNSHAPLQGQPIHQVFALTEAHSQALCRTPDTQPGSQPVPVFTPCGSNVRSLALPVDDHTSSQYLLLWHPTRSTPRTTVTTDPATGLADRQMLLKQLSPLLGSHNLLEHPHSLIKIHLSGLEQLTPDQQDDLDILMADLAALLRPRTRQRDLLTRSSPDSFTLLLRGCDLTQARRIADKLHQEIRFYHQDYQDSHLPNWHPCLGIMALESGHRGEEALQQVRELAKQACQQQNEQLTQQSADWQEIA